MTFPLLPGAAPLPCSIADLARDTGLSWVTVRNALECGGTLASLDRVRQALGYRWSWSGRPDLLRAGRDLATRRRGKGISQREMATRLDISPQTVLALETRFAGRSETLARYLRILGQHEVLALPTRRLVPAGNGPEADLVYTPPDLARAIVDELRPHLSGMLLDPASGDGAFHDAFPSALPRHWREIAEGRDFFAWTRPVDWIITNPPFSRFRDFLVHAMAVANNVVFLAPLTHFSTRHRIEAIGRAGFALRRMMLVPTPAGWPSSGFQLAAVWLQKGWRGRASVVTLR